MKELHYHWHCNSWDIGGRDNDTTIEGTLKAIVGECEPIKGFPSLKIESISDSNITIRFLNQSKQLKRGSFVHLSNSVDGYEDHDGVLWNGYNYNLKISWDE